MLLSALLGPLLSARASDAKPPAIEFNRQILPILTDNCFACHGPDEGARKAGLRLDLESEAKQARKSGDYAIVSGQADKSVLVDRIRAHDPDDVMPPPKSGKQLTSDQIALLTGWIAEGARYEQHWSFVPPQRPAPQRVKNRNWPRNDLDRFVAARLEQERLKPAPEADRETLARRVTLDLTGLPPTPKEVDAFLADGSGDAYEKLVDRLLSSPRYGEHMARYWMDAARYADSHGYHIDSERHMWKWRDSVIQAFNRNQPFDRFTIEQLAGDLLPNPTLEQRIASGYLRANMTTGEGGAIEDEYLAKYTFDRNETTAAVWMGLTLTCARCHTHKYDPITHREYYGLYSFFHNLDEPIMDGNRPNPDPFLKLPTEGQRRREEALNQKMEDAKKRLDAPHPTSAETQTAWHAAWRERLRADLSPLSPVEVTSSHGTEFEVLDDGSVRAGGENPSKDVHELTFRPGPGRVGGLRLEALPDEGLFQGAAGRAADGTFRLTRVEAEWVEPAKDGESPSTHKLKINKAFASSWDAEHAPDKIVDDNSESGWSPAGQGLTNVQEVLLALEEPVKLPEGAELRVTLRYEASTNRQSLGRFRLAAATGEDLLNRLFPPKPPVWKILGPFKSPDPAAGLAKVYPPEEHLDFERAYPGVREEIRWQDRGDLVDGERHLLVNELHGVHGVYYLTRTLRLDEERPVQFIVRADDLFRVWVDGKIVAERTGKAEPGDEPVRARFTLPPGDHRVLVKVANLQGACHFTFHQDLNHPLDATPDVAARLLVSPGLEGDNLAPLRRYFLRASDAEWKELDDQLAIWREAKTEIERSIVTTLVAKEREKPRETHMLMRGEYDKPGEIVGPGVPAILPPLPADAPTNRLGLARWLVDPSHPLTARVTVNRFWQQCFGVGLVKTAEDFGVQGERPSHPELLDWLAAEFVQSGWDIKHLMKLMVTSATYRQSSEAKPDALGRDPENRLLARGPRFRVDGEVVRDTALAVSGLLVEEIGGRSVKPYEPPGMWEAVSFNNSQKYVQDLGDANYRRSLYTHWKRQSPPPYMLIFDAPTREYCVVRRPRTNTPLQALALLNDPQFVEASRALAWRILAQGGDSPRHRIEFGFRLVTSRAPDRRERRVLLDVYEAQLKEFSEKPEAADEFLGIGAFRPEGSYQPAELAAWTTLASILLNLDETLTKN